FLHPRIHSPTAAALPSSARSRPRRARVSQFRLRRAYFSIVQRILEALKHLEILGAILARIFIEKLFDFSAQHTLPGPSPAIRAPLVFLSAFRASAPPSASGTPARSAPSAPFPP